MYNNKIKEWSSLAEVGSLKLVTHLQNLPNFNNHSIFQLFGKTWRILCPTQCSRIKVLSFSRIVAMGWCNIYWYPLLRCHKITHVFVKLSKTSRDLNLGRWICQWRVLEMIFFVGLYLCLWGTLCVCGKIDIVLSSPMICSIVQFNEYAHQILGMCMWSRWSYMCLRDCDSQHLYVCLC